MIVLAIVFCIAQQNLFTDFHVAAVWLPNLWASYVKPETGFCFASRTFAIWKLIFEISNFVFIALSATSFMNCSLLHED